MHWKYPIEVNNLSVGWFLFATWMVKKWLFFEMTFQIISDKNLNNLKICWFNQVNSYLVRSFGFNQVVPNALFLYPSPSSKNIKKSYGFQGVEKGWKYECAKMISTDYQIFPIERRVFRDRMTVCLFEQIWLTIIFADDDWILCGHSLKWKGLEFVSEREYQWKGHPLLTIWERLLQYYLKNCIAAIEYFCLSKAFFLFAWCQIVSVPLNHNCISLQSDVVWIAC